jgi:hypothetical protein
MSFDINDPKVRWAQEIADRTGEKQVIINNAVGGYSIKPQRVVHLQSPDIQVFIEPRNNRRSYGDECGIIGHARFGWVQS